MICKDCLHDEACRYYRDFDECENFKDKSEWVHLPCNIGQKVWIVFTPKYPANPSDKGKWFMVQDGVQRIIFGAKGISIETWNVGTIPQREVGIKLFFTEEEAEKALEERRKK